MATFFLFIAIKIMTYLEKYKDCKRCPVKKYCGTMISSIRLCNSYDETKT